MPQDGTGPRAFVDRTPANRSAYDKIAALYARNQVRLRSEGPPSFGALRSTFRASLPEPGLIADIGCGPGLDAADFTQRGLQVTGLDISAGMLACAHRALVPRLVQADMRALPLATGRLAGIWCLAALLHVEENRTPDVLREFRRVLCPGGALALVTASGEIQGLETAPYAPVERRWFVYRQPERLRKELATDGFVIVSEERVELGRLWWACLAKAAWASPGTQLTIRQRRRRSPTAGQAASAEVTTSPGTIDLTHSGVGSPTWLGPDRMPPHRQVRGRSADHPFQSAALVPHTLVSSRPDRR